MQWLFPGWSTPAGQQPLAARPTTRSPQVLYLEDEPHNDPKMGEVRLLDIIPGVTYYSRI